jgi:hypothetical protein
MAKFCGSCGAQLSDNSAFCIQCGTAQNAAAPPTPQPPVQPPVQPPPPAQPGSAQVNAPAPAPYIQVNAPTSAPPPVKSSGSGLKILLGILAVLFVGAVVVVGGLFYIGHRVVNKIKATAAENGLSLPDKGPKRSSSSTSVLHRDYCGLLSKDDVSAAIGIPIIAIHAVSDGCEYLAQGTSADMTARHMSAMMAAKGADNQTQDTIHKLAGGLFSAQQSESKEQTSDENGNVPVVVFGVDTNSARTQMQLNEKILGGLGSRSPKIEGIGDEAFDSAGGMMFVRKGETLIRITYLMCPCTTDAIEPLARKLADGI